MRLPARERVKSVVAWTPAVLCGTWALFRLAGWEPGYPLIPLMTYTPYVFPLAVLATVLALALRRWWAGALALTAALMLAAVLLPRVLGTGDLPSGGTHVGLMSANVLRGHADPAELLELAREREVDILALQEVTPEFIAEFEAAGAQRAFRYSAVAAEEDVSGSAIYATGPVRPLGAGDLPLKQMRATVRLRGGRLFDVTSVHPNSPTSTSAVERWRAGLDALPKGDRDRSFNLLLGDFNSTLDNSEIRDLLDTGYKDVAEVSGGGLEATWPAMDRPFRYMPVAIDHLLVSDQLDAGSYEVLDLDGTDHRPVYGELVFGLSL